MHEKIVCQENGCNSILSQCRCPSEHKTVIKRGYCIEHKSSWFVWNWNSDEIVTEKNIVVSRSWVELNEFKDGKGKVVSGPFVTLTDAISKCDELNVNG